MREPLQTPVMSRAGDDPRELQAKLYREIGISAVAAALRFTTQPMPDERTKDTDGRKPARHGTDLAA